MENENKKGGECLGGNLEGKAVCHSYESLVGELAGRMEIKEKMLLANKKDKFDPEDIFSWIRAVDYKNTESAPDVQAILSTKQGRETLTFDVKKEATIENEDEEVTQEQLLYMMAQTEAKMKVVSTIAEEVYPALAFQIKDYRKEMEKMREEVLENKEEKRSLKEVMSGLASKKVLTYAVVGALILLYLTSCGKKPETNNPIFPSPTMSPVVEVTQVATPTLEATATEIIEKDVQLLEWDKIELNIGGKPMEFAVGTEEGAGLTNKWGIKSVEINDNLVDAEKKFSDMMGASFWQIYVAQSGENITYEDFLASSEKYKINMSVSDGAGGYKTTEFSMDQIKRFERRFIGTGDARLTRNFQIPGQVEYSYGYKFDNEGTFTLYESFGGDSASWNAIFSPNFPLFGKPEFGYIAGDDIGQSFLEKMYDIGFDPGTTSTWTPTETPTGTPMETPESTPTEGVVDNSTKMLEFSKAVIEKGGLPNIDDMIKKEGGTSLENSAKYFTDYGFWKVQTSTP